MMRDRNLLLPVFYVLVVLFLFFPILIMAPISFSNGRFLSFPPEEFGLRWYRAYFTDPVWMSATFRSLRVALGASILATFVGTLSVVGLGRRRNKTSGILTAVFVAPAIVPSIIVALGVFIFAIRLGLSDNELTLICAHAAVGLPFVVLMVGSAYRQIDPTLERAARIMGAGPVRAFLTATFPPLTPAILSAGIFAFFVSFDELIISLFLMSSAETLPMRIWNDLRFEINPTIAAVSVFFVLVKGFKIASGCPQAMQHTEEVAFSSAVRSGLEKVGAGRARSTSGNPDFAIQQLVNRAVASTKVMDILVACGFDRPDISVLPDIFMIKIQNLQHKNLAVESLKNS